MLEAIISPNVDVKKVCEDVGFGVFSNKLLSKHTVIYRDRAFVSIQHTANRRFVKACQNCHKPLGSIREQFKTLFNEERFERVDVSALPDDGNDLVNCVCGEIYCSIQCGAEAHERHHFCLCVVGSGIHGEAVAAFKYFCLSIEGCGDNLLLLSQLLATVCSKSQGKYENFRGLLDELLTFTNRPFNEVARPPDGSERDAGWEKWLEETLSEAFELLCKALVHQTEIFGQFFANKIESFSILSRLLSIFELNNIDIAIPSKLGAQVLELSRRGFPVDPIVREKEVIMRALWNDEARGIYEDEIDEDDDQEMSDMDDSDSDEVDEHFHDNESIDEMLNEIRSQVSEIPIERLLEESEYPNFHGTGFFLSVARTNHSCEPNVSMDFDDGKAIVSCKTLRDINPGEEIRMSYISCPSIRSKKVRQSLLKDYLFTCNCSLCSSQ